MLSSSTLSDTTTLLPSSRISSSLSTQISLGKSSHKTGLHQPSPLRSGSTRETLCLSWFSTRSSTLLLTPSRPGLTWDTTSPTPPTRWTSCSMQMTPEWVNEPQPQSWCLAHFESISSSVGDLHCDHTWHPILVLYAHHSRRPSLRPCCMSLMQFHIFFLPKRSFSVSSSFPWNLLFLHF